MIDGRLFQRSATVLTIRSASTTVCGWVFIAISCSASLNNSTVRMQTLVPPPTSLSRTLGMLMRILAAALSSRFDLRMVASSLVTLKSPVDVDFCLGVDLTRSPMVSASSKEGGETCIFCFFLGRLVVGQV